MDSFTKEKLRNEMGNFPMSRTTLCFSEGEKVDTTKVQPTIFSIIKGAI